MLAVCVISKGKISSQALKNKPNQPKLIEIKLLFERVPSKKKKRKTGETICNKVCWWLFNSFSDHFN